MLCIHSPTSLDLKAITTFGLSVKVTDNPIGQFGTGLKYAIAVLLRNKQSIKLIVDGTNYDFAVEPSTFRGESVETVTMNGQLLPFTLNLGRNWEVWMALRELIANALDEGGGVSEEPCGKTCFIVDGPTVSNAWVNRHEIFLKPTTSPLLVSKRLEVYPEPSNYIFYRGIRVSKIPQGNKLTYNIMDGVSLSEDRFVDYWASRQLILSEVISSGSPQLFRKFFTSREPGEADIPSWCFPSLESVPGTFTRAIAEISNLPGRQLNKTAESLRMHLQSLCRVDPYEPIEVTDPIAKANLDRAIKTVKGFGYDLTKFPIVVASRYSIPRSVLALALYEKKIIVVSDALLEYPFEEIVSTLIEEFVHLTTSFVDCSRELQTWLLNRLVQLHMELAKRSL